jgi:hypothetical protein
VTREYEFLADGVLALPVTLTETGILGAGLNPGIGFGGPVAISGDGLTAIAGALYGDSGGNNAGEAYVFTPRSRGSVLDLQLLAGDGSDSDRFAGSVTLSANGLTAAVGTAVENTGQGDTSRKLYTDRPDVDLTF